jgi:hypothetical protein
MYHTKIKFFREEEYFYGCKSWKDLDFFRVRQGYSLVTIEGNHFILYHKIESHQRLKILLRLLIQFSKLLDYISYIIRNFKCYVF